MPGLQVLSAPQNQPTLNPKVQAPIQPTIAPRVVSAPPQPVLSPRVVTQPPQPSLAPKALPAPQGQGAITSIGTATEQQPYTQRLSLEEFGNLIKQKYPQYADKDSAELAQKMIQKYPEYKDLVVQPVQGEEKPSIGGFIGNIGKSGAEAVKNVLTAVLHPINTIEGIAKVLGGATASTFTLGQKSTPEFDGLISFLKDRYGSVDNIKKTAYEDPVGFLIDLSTVLDAGGSLLGKLGDVSKISELSKAGEVVSKAGEITNPAVIAGKGLKAIANKAGNVASEAAGFVTGAGGGAVKEAYTNPSKGFYQGLRGKVSPEAIVDEAKQALGTAKANRSSSYQSDLAKIKTNGQPLNITPLQKELSNQLKKFGVEMDETGGLNFDNSTISDPAEQAKIQRAYDDINRWGKNPNNLTPAGVDTLKRRLDNLYSPNSDVRAFTATLKNKARELLNNQVPGYEEMTKAYQQASDFIDDVTKGLSLSDRASTDTALRKLASALKQNNEFRTELVKQLEEIGGKDLTGKIAGYNLSAALPRGLFGKLVEGSTVLAAFKGLASLFSLPTLSALATTSPRLVGEVVAALGVSTQKASEIVNYLQRSHAGRTLRIGSKAGYYEQKATGNTQNPSLRESKQ